MFLLLGAFFHMLIALANGAKNVSDLILAVNLDRLSGLGYLRIRIIISGLLSLAEFTPMQKYEWG